MNNNNKSTCYDHGRKFKFLMLKVTKYAFRMFETCLLVWHFNNVKAIPTASQISIQDPVQVILEGTIHIYLVTNYGEKMQEVNRYYKTGEGSMIAFILETDQKIEMSYYLYKEEVEALREYSGETLQSHFLLSPDYTIYETSLFGMDFANMYANKRVRVTGTLFFPMAGWQNVTPVRMDFTKVEMVE